MNDLALPEGWVWKKLVDIVENHDGKRRPVKSIDREALSGEYPYYGASGVIDYVDEYLFDGEYLLISEDGANLVARKTPIAFIATGKFWVNNHAHVVRAKENLVSNHYLQFYFAAADISSSITGSAQPKLSQSKMNEINIPVPPINEQRRIVAKIDAAFSRLDTAIQLQKQNIARTDEMKKSVLEEVFGKGEWEVKKLGEVAEISRGKSKHRPRNDKSLLGGKYPFIQTGDVRNASKYITEYSETYNEKGLAQSKLWQKGTICLTIAANIGDVAILGIDACFPDSVVGIFSKENDNDYIYYYLTTLKNQFESKASQAAQMNLSVEKIVGFGIPIPPLPEQQAIVHHLDRSFAQLDALRTQQTTRLHHLENLKSSILTEAFQGKL